MQQREIKHIRYLNELVRRLDEVDEDRHSLISIIREPIWTPNYDLQDESLCDLILIYHDHTTVPIELKGHYCQRSKAMYQVKQGFKYSFEVLQMQPRYGKFVWHRCPDEYKYYMIKK